VLNGFVLSSGVSPKVTTTTGVFLNGGVQVLSFEDIQAQIDTAQGTGVYPIVIGDATRPLTVEPSIYLNHITNLVADSSATTIPTLPVTTPSVQITVNGVLRNFDIVSATQGPVAAAFQFLLPVVGTTGRTAIQATAIKRLKVRGSAKNFTASRTLPPFQTQGS